MIQRAHDRLQLMSSSQAAEWAEATLADIGRGLQYWQERTDRRLRLDAVSDARLASEVLLAILLLIEERQERRQEALP
jgi:hypothetical protein